MMSHVNVNPGGVPVAYGTADRTGAAGFSLAASLIALASVVAAFWFLLSDPIAAFVGGGSTAACTSTCPANRQ